MADKPTQSATPPTTAKPARPPSPWSMFDDFDGDFSRTMEQFFHRDPFRRLGLPTRMKGFDFAPTVDVVERPDAYEITAELPGVEEKDVSVTLDNGIITITGQKESEKKDEAKHVSERHYGSFQRSFSLPEDADDQKTNADFSKGVLKVTIGRATKPKSGAHKIDIKSA